ncbi:hypothetical protein BH10PSE7_BH10PSE7_40340 [soil metagenome]
MGLRGTRSRSRIATYAFVLSTRAAYVFVRLVIVLGLPYVLGAAALGMFATITAMIAVLPVLVGLGVPGHLHRRLGVSLHLPSFRAWLFQTFAGGIAAAILAYAWICVYPDFNRTIGLTVAVVAAVEVIKAGVYQLCVARSVVVRSNVAYVLSGAGPSLVVLASLLSGTHLSLSVLVIAWLVTNILATVIGATVIIPDVGKLRRAAFDWRNLSRRYGASVRSSQNIYLNQVVDVVRVYCDRMIVPLVAGFHMAGIYGFFSLAASMAVMMTNATLGQTDLPHLLKAASERSWPEFERLLTEGLKRTCILPVIIMCPLFVLRPLAEIVLKTPIEGPLFFALSIMVTLVAICGSLADYLWYAVYAAHGERKLAKTAIGTIPFTLLSVAIGSLAGGIVGAAFAVALSSAVVAWLRYANLRDLLLSQKLA